MAQLRKRALRGMPALLLLCFALPVDGLLSPVKYPSPTPLMVTTCGTRTYSLSVAVLATHGEQHHPRYSIPSHSADGTWRYSLYGTSVTLLSSSHQARRCLSRPVLQSRNNARVSRNSYCPKNFVKHSSSDLVTDGHARKANSAAFQMGHAVSS